MPSQHTERQKRLSSIVKMIVSLRTSSLNDAEIEMEIHRYLMVTWFYNQNTRQDYIDTANEIIKANTKEPDKKPEILSSESID